MRSTYCIPARSLFYPMDVLVLRFEQSVKKLLSHTFNNGCSPSLKGREEEQFFVETTTADGQTPPASCLHDGYISSPQLSSVCLPACLPLHSLLACVLKLFLCCNSRQRLGSPLSYLGGLRHWRWEKSERIRSFCLVRQKWIDAEGGEGGTLSVSRLRLCDPIDLFVAWRAAAAGGSIQVYRNPLHSWFFTCPNEHELTCVLLYHI